MVSEITVNKFHGEIDGAISLPGSKSISSRAIMMAMSSEGLSTLEGLLLSDDSKWGLAAAEALGCAVYLRGTTATIQGIGRKRPVINCEVHVGAAGTVARFLPGLLAAGEAGRWTLTADEQMMKRPVDTLVDGLRQAGAEIDVLGSHGSFPLSVCGGTLHGGDVEASGTVSSQFISGLALSGPLLSAPLVIKTGGDIVQSHYVNITIDCMRSFGAEVEATSNLDTIRINPVPYRATNFSIEADASTATYFAALPALLGGSITLANLRPDTLQPDINFLDVLQQMGCKVTCDAHSGITVARPTGLKRLKGNRVFDLRACSDSAPTVVALSIFADGPVRISGVSHIRHHECDRIAAMTAALRRMQIDVKEHSDGWTITPGEPVFAQVQTQDDHRVAMSMALVGLAGNGIRLDHPNCVAKTCPNFFKMIASLGAKVG